MQDNWLYMIYDWLSLLFGLPIWPGVIGSVGALLWIQGTWPRKIAMVGLGSVTSYYGGEWVVSVTGLDPKFAGFIVGLFGMSIVDKSFETWSELGLTDIVREFIRARLGLPPKGK